MALTNPVKRFLVLAILALVGLAVLPTLLEMVADWWACLE